MTTTSKTPAYIQHLCAENDRNGNPRRIWALYADDGTVISYTDEGYNGRAPILGLLAVELPPVDITPSHYHTLKSYII